MNQIVHTIPQPGVVSPHLYDLTPEGAAIGHGKIFAGLLDQQRIRALRAGDKEMAHAIEAYQMRLADLADQFAEDVQTAYRNKGAA